MFHKIIKVLLGSLKKNKAKLQENYGAASSRSCAENENVAPVPAQRFLKVAPPFVILRHLSHGAAPKYTLHHAARSYFI